MSTRFPLLLLLAVGALVPATAAAQSVDGEHIEVIAPPPNAPPPPPAPDLARVTARVVELTNKFRKAEGRGEVGQNDKLTATAQAFADYMARTGRYGHTADGSRPADRAVKQGYEYCLIAENIAYVYRSTAYSAEELAGQLVEGWKNSPGHRRNMLDGDMTETGVAVARGPQSGYFFAVQLFGRPKSLTVEFRIANNTAAAVSYTIDEQSFELPPRYTRTHRHCRPPQVAFRAPEGSKEAGTTLRPKGGERYAVEATAAGGLKVVAQ